MNKLESMQKELETTISHHEALDFPDFIFHLRKCLCVSRKNMAEEVKEHHLKLFLLESGKFERELPGSILRKLAEYFGVPMKILESKCLDYINSRKEKKDDRRKTTSRSLHKA